MVCKDECERLKNSEIGQSAAKLPYFKEERSTTIPWPGVGTK